MQNVNRGLDKTGKKLQGLGSKLSVGLTLPLAALGAASINAFDKQAKGIAQVEAGLKSTQNQVGKTSKELQQMASDLQSNSLFGDEEILKDVTAQLLTFTNIAGEQFDRTQLAALDLATRLDGDLKSASIQLGKALNDPVANLSALSRSGIQFSESQKSTINALVETNKLADAQTIILNELEKQYGGSAEAAARAGKGPLTQLSNILGDVTEDFGKIILEGILPFVDKLKSIALSFKNLSPTTKKWIVILGGIAAAIGPLLALAGTILPAIGTGLALLTGPIGLLVAGLVAVGVVIYKNWAPIKKTLIDIANYFIELYNESTLFRIAVEAVVARFKIMWEIGKFVFEALKSVLKSFVDSFVDRFKLIGKIFKAVFTDKGSISDIPDIIKEASKKGRENFGELTNNLGNDWKNLVTGIEKVTNKGLENITSRKKLAYIKENVDASAITEAVSDATVKGLAQGAAGGRAKVSGVDTSGLAQGVSLSGGAGIAADLPEKLQTASVSLTDFELRLFDFQNATADILSNVAGNFTEGFANIIAGVVQGNVGFAAVGGLLLQTLGDLATQIGKAAIKIGITMKAVKLSFANPLAAIAAGAGLLVVGALLKSLAGNFGGGGGGFAGSFASGGIVGGSSFYGDKLLARVNSGEAIFNQEQQKRLYNLTEQSASAVDVQVGGSVVIDGATLRVVLDRADKLQNRLG